ncbi:MAG: hypothetical protein AB7N65_11495 [Vicinamibacterales bacterium]
MRASWASLLLVAALLPGSPRSASAQGIANTFDELRLLVKLGETLTVYDTTGHEQRGRLDSLSTSSLVLRRGRERVDIAETDVSRIEATRSDSLRNGALIGMGVGAGLILGAFVMSCDSECGDEAGLLALATLGYAGIGAGIGTGIDALIQSRQPIFERRRVGQILLSPIIGRGRAGAALSVGF